ncbi:MAG: Trk family potassium uptake protein [Solobacterium sp.]|nr:Trk family potassium uptake protein [Solobacterium sp.]
MSVIPIMLRRHITSFRVILFGFACVILLGAILLYLPVSTVQGKHTTLINALFTSASAVCVTGLTVYDTSSHWTLFGKIVLLLLIQIGGLGVITVAVAAFIITGRRIGIMQRTTMQDAISAPQIGGIVRMTKHILIGTLMTEAAGAFLLCPVFCRDMGPGSGMFSAVFHSVSAFCNAGFDIMGVQQTGTSLSVYSDSVLVNTVIMALIIAGGLGFLTWQDLFRNGIHNRKLRLQSKIVLIMTFVLIVIPFLWFYTSEFSAYTGKKRVLYALFHSVTPRTAGFSTFDYSRMSEGSLLITILLMIAGGAPGSTAGGMKITSLYILFISSFAFMKRKDDVSTFGRRIEPSVIRNAMVLLVLYLSLLIAGSLIVSYCEKLPVLPSMFECASALGTVGLSCGITQHLSSLSKILLTGFMFFGRVGGLTVAYAAGSRQKEACGKYPAEYVAVG